MINRFGRELQCCLNILASEARIGLQNDFDRIPIRNGPNNNRHGNPSALNAGVAMMNGWINRNAITPIGHDDNYTTPTVIC